MEWHLKDNTRALNQHLVRLRPTFFISLLCYTSNGSSLQTTWNNVTVNMDACYILYVTDVHISCITMETLKALL